MLTVKECKYITTHVKSDSYGTPDYHKGRCFSFGLTGDEELPKGFEFIHIPSWGLHLREVK
jgi:hypothetical protein